MQPASILGAEVVVSAQAKGQTAAINRQLNASGIISAVSGEKLSELPDVKCGRCYRTLAGTDGSARWR